MSWSSLSAEGADVFGALRAYMVQGLGLEASYNSRSGWWFRSIGDNDGVVAGSGLHNHLQSSGENNTSRAHSRSTSSANPSPASLSWHSILTILLFWGKERCGSGTVREGVGPSSQLENGVDGSVHGGERVSRGGIPCRSRGVGIGRLRQEHPILWLLWNLLCHLFTTVVSSALLL